MQVEKSLKAQGINSRPLELVPPKEVPPSLEHIWYWFLDLNSCRQMGFSGPSGITFSEIKAWSELTCVNPRPEEVAAIKRLDNLYLKVANGKL